MEQNCSSGLRTLQDGDYPNRNNKMNIFTSLITLKEGFTHAKLHLSLKHSVGKTGQILFSQHNRGDRDKIFNIFKKVKRISIIS